MTEQERAQIGERIADLSQVIGSAGPQYEAPAILLTIIAASVLYGTEEELLAMLRPWVERKAGEARAELMVREATEES